MKKPKRPYKKLLEGITIAVVAIVILTVCILILLWDWKDQQINYEGELQYLDYISEHIEGRLEEENPGMDIEVDVYLEMEEE